MDIYLLELVFYDDSVGGSINFTWEKAYKTEKDASKEKTRLLKEYEKDLKKSDELYARLESLSLELRKGNPEYIEVQNGIKQIEGKWPCYLDLFKCIDIHKIELVEGDKK